MFSGYTDEEKLTLARWHGESAKEWWTRLDDAGRAQISKMDAGQIFSLGWVACRASDASKRKTYIDNDDPDGGDDGSGFGS